jgi:type I restriction enzyme S subunit
MSKLDSLVAELCPNGVEYKTLGELGEFYGGLTGKSKEDFSDGNAKFITYMNVFSNFSINTDITDSVKVGIAERQNSVQLGDVLFTSSSETLDECGMAAVLTVQIENPLYLNSFCFGFRLHDTSLLLPGFSKFLFRSEALRKQIVRTASGVTRFNVSKEKMKKIRIPLPPLPVQSEIAKILDNFAELTAEIAKEHTAELTARKKQYEYYRQSLLSLPDVPRISLGEVGRVAMCKRIMKAETTPDGEVPFYKIGTFGKAPDAYISTEIYERYRRDYSFPKKGDILISAAGTIGRAVIFNGEPAYYQDSNIVWLEHDESQVMNKYLFYIYQLSPWHISTGGTISRLYNDNITKARIPLPSLEEQTRIVEILDKFDSLTTDITAGLPAEIAARQKQYEYYRDKLLTFKERVT